MKNENLSVSDTMFFRQSVRSTYLTCFIEKRALDTFLFNWVTWWFQVKCSSIYIPRNLVAFSVQLFPIFSNSVPLILIYRSVKSVRNCLGRITIYLVFFAFRDSFFQQNHLNKLFICVFASAYNWSRLDPDIYSVVSSANDSMFAWQELPVSFT